MVDVDTNKCSNRNVSTSAFLGAFVQREVTHIGISFCVFQPAKKRTHLSMWQAVLKYVLYYSILLLFAICHYLYRRRMVRTNCANGLIHFGSIPVDNGRRATHTHTHAYIMFDE